MIKNVHSKFQNRILNISHGQTGSSGLAVSLNLMTFRLSGQASWLPERPTLPFNSFMCGELWHVESQDSRSATPSYFHRKQTLRQLGLPLLHPLTVASFQDHHLRALLIIWQVFSKINYGQLLSCNCLERRGSIKKLLQHHSQVPIFYLSRCQWGGKLVCLFSSRADAWVQISWMEINNT